MRILILLLLLALAACTNRPGEADVKAELEGLSRLCNQCYSVTIVDSISTDKDNYHIVCFKAIIEMRKPAYFIHDDSLPPSAGIDLQDIRVHRDSKKDIPINVGARYEFNGAVYYLKNASGWFTDGEVVGALTKL
jgi:hypothetical protein